MADVADLCNQALAQIGYRPFIGDLFEGSPAAKFALNIYGQTRDETLRLMDWDFARKTLALVVSGLTVPQPWTFAYTYPADCLFLRAVLPAVPNTNNPAVVRWAVADDDQGGTAQKVILTNQAGALACYTAQVVTIGQWDSIFTKAVVATLAMKFSQGLTSQNQAGPTVNKSNMEEAMATVAANRTG